MAARAMHSDENAREIVKTVLHNHPRDCIFNPGAVDRIVEHTPVGLSKDELIEYLVHAIEAEEIYCPREGIDRRAECGWPHQTTIAWQQWSEHAHEMV